MPPKTGPGCALVLVNHIAIPSPYSPFDLPSTRNSASISNEVGVSGCGLRQKGPLSGEMSAPVSTRASLTATACPASNVCV